MIKVTFPYCNQKPRPSVCFSLANDNAYPALNGMFVECIDLEHCALLVEIELDSGGQLLFLSGEVLCERGGQTDGALRDGGVFPHTPSGPGIPTDLQHTRDNDERDKGLTARFLSS